mgnify:CR=1 FL=1
MIKSAGSILADILTAKEKGASQGQLNEMSKKFARQTRRQLSCAAKKVKTSFTERKNR